MPTPLIPLINIRLNYENKAVSFGINIVKETTSLIWTVVVAVSTKSRFVKSAVNLFLIWLFKWTF